MIWKLLINAIIFVVIVTKAGWSGVPRNGSLWLASCGSDAAARSFVESSLDHDLWANHTVTRWKLHFSSHPIHDAWLRGRSYGWREPAPAHSLQTGQAIPSKQKQRKSQLKGVMSLLFPFFFYFFHFLL